MVACMAKQESGKAGSNGEQVRAIGQPVFAQPEPTADPTTFKVPHASDAASYHAIDQLNAAHKLFATAVPAPRSTKSGSTAEPVITLQEVLGGNAPALATIARNKQIVFHSCGDCGSTRGPQSQNGVTDKMIADFDEALEREIPQFHFLLGDIVYSFGEIEYYYDQFYDPYRNYPAPILAAAGNHDGMVPPGSPIPSLKGYLRNFCTPGFVVLPEAGGLSRTAQIQPGVYFTFEAPFVRIISLYSNTLEDPGVIADPTPGTKIGTAQLTFLQAALTRARADSESGLFQGAVILAHHHPPFSTGSRHGWSAQMQMQIDRVCAQVGFWPHADLSGHAHNYQRFTRTCSITVSGKQSRTRRFPTSSAATAGTRCRNSAGAAEARCALRKIVQTGCTGEPAESSCRASRARELRRYRLRLLARRSRCEAAAHRVSSGDRRQHVEDARRLRYRRSRHAATRSLPGTEPRPAGRSDARPNEANAVPAQTQLLAVVRRRAVGGQRLNKRVTGEVGIGRKG